MTKEFKLSEESAREQLEIFTEYYDCDFEGLEEEQQRAVKTASSRVIRGIRRGLLEISTKEDGSLQVKQTLAKGGEALYYAEISGQSKIAMKTCKGDDYNGRIYALVGSLTGIGAAGILKIKGQDLSLVEALGVLFLQV